MRSSRLSDEQIIGMIKEQEAGMPTAEVCRKHGISTASFYNYKAKFGGGRSLRRNCFGPKAHRCLAGPSPECPVEGGRTR